MEHTAWDCSEDVFYALLYSLEQVLACGKPCVCFAVIKCVCMWYSIYVLRKACSWLLMKSRLGRGMGLLEDDPGSVGLEAFCLASLLFLPFPTPPET